MRQFYYKMRQLLQNATFIIDCDSILDGYGSKIWKTSRCIPAETNETIQATRQEFLFTK